MPDLPELLEAWCSWGLPPDTFWNCTPREYIAITAGAAKRQQAESQHAKGLVYSLAQLVSFATHSPKKMPKFDKVFPGAQRAVEPQSPDDVAAMFRMLAAGMK